MNDRLNDREKLMDFTFSEITQILSQTHRVLLSEPTLKRTTSKLGLFRHKNKSDIGDVALFIEETLESHVVNFMDTGGCTGKLIWQDLPFLKKIFNVFFLFQIQRECG
jgi:hypothetical protein